jgi:hypothetical protein
VNEIANSAHFSPDTKRLWLLSGVASYLRIGGPTTKRIQAQSDRPARQISHQIFTAIGKDFI